MRLGALAWRGMLARPLRTALSLAGVALGVAVVTASMITGASSEGALRSATADLLGRADIRLRAFAETGFTPRVVQAVRGISGVTVAAPVAERRLTAYTAPGVGERVFTLLTIGIDPDVDAELRPPDLVEGVPLSPDSPTDALVSASWAEANDLGLGDEIHLDGRRPGLPPLRLIGLLRDTGFAALEQGEVLVVSRTTLDESFEVPAPIRYLDVDLADGAEAQARSAVITAMTEAYVLETADDAAARLAAAQASFTGIAFVLGLVALVVGAFLVGNTLAMTVGERTRELGLLRAAGTTSRQVLGIVVRQAVALGVVGSAAGIALGIVLAAAMITFLQSTRAVLVEGLPLPLPALAAAFVLGVLVTLAGAVAPALRAAWLSPVDALRPSMQRGRGLGPRIRWLVVIELGVVIVGVLLVPATGADAALLPLVLSLGLLVGGAIAAAFLVEPLGAVIGRPFEWFFGAQGLLGRADLSRESGRTGLTVGAMMIALAAVVALGTVAESARAGTERWVGSILPGGHAIRSSVPLDVDAFRPTFEATPGVLAASPILEFPAVRVIGDVQEETAVAGIDVNVFEDHDALIIDGATREAAFGALRAGGAALVPSALARRAELEVGDVMTLAQPGLDGIDFTVAGIVEYTIPARTPEGAVLISSADARAAFGAATSSLWVMVPQRDVPASAFAAGVRDTASQLAGQPLTPRELAGDLARALDRLVGLFDVLAMIAVVIAALGIVNTLSIGVSERVREIAILRSHGMTVGQVQAMVVAEAAMMGAMAGVLALAVGIGVAYALVSSGASADLGAGLRLPWGLLVTVVLVGTGISALAGLYPARVAASLPIVGSLKHFE